MKIGVALIALLLTASTAGIASALPSPALEQAEVAANRLDWPTVATLIAPMQAQPELLDVSDRAELWRLAGLVAFFEHRLTDAELEFVAYLRLEADGRLDPAVVPPEAIVYFESIRARHGAELRALRPHAKTWSALNWLPPLGQLQNGERPKAWIFGGALVGFAAVNITSYFVLRSWCSSTTLTCASSSADHTSSAKSLRTLNVASGLGLLATYIIGVVDGYSGYRDRTRAPMVQWESAPGGGVISMHLAF